MRTHDVTQWLFELSDERQAWRKNADDSMWRAVVVPHDWAVEQDFSRECSSGTGYLPGGIGWYRAHVPLTALGPIEDRTVRLVFEGVYKNADVWVNGYHLGGRPSGYARFSFDLTEILGYAPDDDLVVAVRVEHTELADSRWYNGAGITRRVRLELHEPVRPAEHGTVVTTAEVSAEHARVSIVQTIENTLPDRIRVRVQHELSSLTTDQTHTSESEADLPGQGSAVVDVQMPVPTPRLWSDDAPHLYRLTTTLHWDGRTATAEQVVGIRTFAFDPDTGFTINGEPRQLKGVCLHEDAGPFGTAVPAWVWLRRLLSLKEMGCNAVRMAHNPHAPELYLLCDVLGLFVIDEAFDEWENPKNKWWQGHNVYPPRHEGYAEHFPQWYESDLVAMIDAHRHHPSIIAWSIGNEIDYPNDPYASPLFDEMTGNNDAHKPQAERLYDPNRPDMRRLTTIAARLSSIVRGADPTRPVTLAAAFPELSSRTGLLETVDLVGYNYKEHLYAEDHRRFPDAPLLGSENSHTYEAWRHVVEADYVAGQFLWTGIDYLGEAQGWPIHGSGAGLLTLAGFPKHIWHLRRSWWSDEPVARLAVRPHEDDDGGPRPFWTHPLSRAWVGEERLEVLCFSNLQELTLTCGDEQVPLERDHEHGYWRAALAPGDRPLVLRGSRDGEAVAEDRLIRPGRPAQIETRVWEPAPAVVSRLHALGLAAEGMQQIECTLLDEHGHPASGEAVLTAQVEGGRLLGLENGDLADLTAYRNDHRSTYEGRLVVFVESDARAIVTVTAPGLTPARVECSP
ncbi:glycoside hydrolase family 2 TIM barrel-domain containing protein [Pseudactinotalea sp.]|uniref:glycoside hydrolase family 2 TIM barrel-domain containing protein n=1 Tax=Pseudactinotalea sp. TaxID=1926260 RepID=UPI003B3BD3C1